VKGNRQIGIDQQGAAVPIRGEYAADSDMSDGMTTETGSTSPSISDVDHADNRERNRFATDHLLRRDVG
jgi:hypothetical protein